MRHLALLSAFFSMASAAPLLPTSYDLVNGDGQASGGGFNYWDLSYNGSGSKTVDGAPLTGGRGDLTDGLIATQRWDVEENTLGTGPYVGWTNRATANPLLTFRFGNAVLVDSVTLYVDDADGYGGVSVPASVDIGLEGGPSVNYLFIDPLGAVPVSFTFSGLGLVGPAVSLRLHQATEWVFVSEVTFDGGVPEPSTVSLTLVALALAARRGLRKSGKEDSAYSRVDVAQ